MGRDSSPCRLFSLTIQLTARTRARVKENADRAPRESHKKRSSSAGMPREAQKCFAAMAPDLSEYDAYSILRRLLHSHQRRVTLEKVDGQPGSLGCPAVRVMSRPASTLSTVADRQKDSTWPSPEQLCLVKDTVTTELQSSIMLSRLLCTREQKTLSPLLFSCT